MAHELQRTETAWARSAGRIRQDIWLGVLAVGLSAWSVCAFLGAFPLLMPDEGRNAEVAREMAESHSWLVPTYDGATYLDKPAFFFKAVALSFQLFGESEATARLVSAGFALALLGAVFLFCRRVYGFRTAALSLMIVATTPLYMAFSRIVIFDMTLAFFVSTAILACYLAEDRGGLAGVWWYRLAAALAGLATLVKGPVGFLIPTLVLVATNRLEGRTGVLKRAFAPLNILIFLALVLPWFVGLSLQCPDFPYYGIMKESVARFTTSEFKRTAPLYFYGLIIAACFFPWSLLLPEAVASAWRARRRWASADRLFIVWAVVVVVFFSLSQSKLPGYILTVTVALGVLLGRLFAAAFADSNGRAAAIVGRASLLLGLLATGAAAAVAAIIRNPGILEQHLHKLSHADFVSFLPLFPSIALSLVVVAILALAARSRRDPRLCFATLISVPLLLATVGFGLVINYADIHSSKSLAERIPPDLPSDAELACLQCLPNGLPFYRKRLVTVISDSGQELTSNYVLFKLASNGPRPARIIALSGRDQWLASREHPVYLLAHWDEHSTLETLASRYGTPVTDLGRGYRAALLLPQRGDP